MTRTPLPALCRQLRDLDPLAEPETTKEIGREAAERLEEYLRRYERTLDQLNALKAEHYLEKDAAAGLRSCAVCDLPAPAPGHACANCGHRAKKEERKGAVSA